MDDQALSKTRALELRYDGPVPAHHFESEERARRRDRGTIAVLESQATDFLDAAIRCHTEIEEVHGDFLGRSLARWQRDSLTHRLAACRTRLEAHVQCAAEALIRAAVLRRRIAQPPHPMFRIAGLLNSLAMDDVRDDGG